MEPELGQVVAKAQNVCNGVLVVAVVVVVVVVVTVVGPCVYCLCCALFAMIMTSGSPAK